MEPEKILELDLMITYLSALAGREPRTAIRFYGVGITKQGRVKLPVILHEPEPLDHSGTDKPFVFRRIVVLLPHERVKESHPVDIVLEYLLGSRHAEEVATLLVRDGKKPVHKNVKEFFSEEARIIELLREYEGLYRRIKSIKRGLEDLRSKGKRVKEGR